jgi:hypothetical protein
MFVAIKPECVEDAKRMLANATKLDSFAGIDFYVLDGKPWLVAGDAVARFDDDPTWILSAIKGRTAKPEFSAQFSQFVNSSGCKTMLEQARASVRDHLTLVQSKMRFCMLYIEEVARAPYTDLRNEASVKLAKKIMAATDECDRALPLI